MPERKVAAKKGKSPVGVRVGIVADALGHSNRPAATTAADRRHDAISGQDGRTTLAAAGRRSHLLTRWIGAVSRR
jgi:hypothetical protein